MTHDEILAKLQERFEARPELRPGVTWKSVAQRLEGKAMLLDTVARMEESGGEPAVVKLPSDKEWSIIDCAPESPAGRRSLCYDKKALDSRKSAKPRTSAEQMAQEIGIELLSEDEYRELQSLVPVDQKTSSWLLTPESVRKLGGSIFGDRRFDRVFVYHNGAESYYASRGFRGKLTP